MKPDLANRTVADLKRQASILSVMFRDKISEILPLMKADESFTLVPGSE